MERFVELFKRFVRDDEGQDLVEYAMLLGLIALVCVGAVTLLGTSVQTTLDNLAAALPLG
jgi:pilus assembly protein Flp/PilA